MKNYKLAIISALLSVIRVCKPVFRARNSAQLLKEDDAGKVLTTESVMLTADQIVERYNRQFGPFDLTRIDAVQKNVSDSLGWFDKNYGAFKLPNGGQILETTVSAEIMEAPISDSNGHENTRLYRDMDIPAQWVMTEPDDCIPKVRKSSGRIAKQFCLDYLQPRFLELEHKNSLPNQAN